MSRSINNQDTCGFLCKCSYATSQKRHLTRVILFTVNYCLFANGDVSIRFSGKDDNVVLELLMYEKIPFIKIFSTGIGEADAQFGYPTAQ